MTQIDAAVQQILNEYEERSAKENELWPQMERDHFLQVRDQFLLAVGPATGQFMNLLVKEGRFRSILEIGTSFGYSTVWLAEAARAVGGRVITLEYHPDKQKYAREQVTRAGLGDFVDFRLGDARESLSSMKETVDFVLLDLWKDLYIPCFDLFYPKLNPGAIVVADNMIYPESAQQNAANYRHHLKHKADLQSVLLQVGSGIEVSRCVRGVEAALR